MTGAAGVAAGAAGAWATATNRTSDGTSMGRLLGRRLAESTSAALQVRSAGWAPIGGRALTRGRGSPLSAAPAGALRDGCPAARAAQLDPHLVAGQYREAARDRFLLAVLAQQDRFDAIRAAGERLP